MNDDSIALLLLYVCLAAFFGYRAWAKRAGPSEQPSGVETVRLANTPFAKPKEDPFLEAVAQENARAKAKAEAAKKALQQEMDAKLSADEKLKAKLAKFAKDNNLDTALTQVWEAVKHYGTWSKREDWHVWNRLQLEGVSGGGNLDDCHVEFTHNARNYRIEQKRSMGYDSAIIHLTFYENQEEVFSISCSLEDKYEMTYLRCYEVAAFKRKGNWASTLYELKNRDDLAQAKAMASFREKRASDIQHRFSD